jgi:DedD protein
MEQAKAFLKKVKGQGLKGDIESGNSNGKPWHRVVVFFQGTPTDTRSLKDKLAGLGAQKLVMRSKTPAN